MKKTVAVSLMILGYFLFCAAPAARANGWATAGKVLAGVAGADLLFNGSNSMVGRTVSGIGNIFTGGNAYGYSSCNAGYGQPAYYSSYGYSQRRCWEEIRRVAAYDYYGNFIGYLDKRATVCTQY